MIYDDDQEYKFTQDPPFQWTTGVDQPDCYALISVDTAETQIFMKQKPDVYKVWMKIYDLDEIEKMYEIKSAHKLADFEKVVKSF